MNPNLEELMREAGYAAPELATRSKKLAELIILKCVEVAIHKDCGMIATADVAGHMAAGRANAADMILKHFGVEK